MRIHVEVNPLGEWQAIDLDTYDCDCDDDGFFSLSPTGYGKTSAEAIADLHEQMSEQA